MGKKASTSQLRFSRVDFYRLRGQEFFETVFNCINRELGEGKRRADRFLKLNPLQQGIFGWWCFWGDLENGGPAQFFYNCGDAYVPAIDHLLKKTGNAPLAALLKQATTVYRKHRKEFETENPWGENGLFARMTELDKLGNPMLRQLNGANKRIEKWLRTNFSVIAVGDDGESIDPTFSGEIETHHPNGKVFEQATIRRGAVSGPYHRFFDDGTLEYSCFYQAGELSTDYWPNGQPKHKTMKRAKLKIHEWYYPSGDIQKRVVLGKTGEIAEPVRMWHENGQLAEELHMRRGRRFGPWLKFFDDGKPKLEAEHGKNEALIVHNAWDDERRQVVKNGKGTYVDDGRDIEWEYDLYIQHQWIRSMEVKNGIPHGPGKTWSDGVLWSHDTYANGQLDGPMVSFYDNGRIRTKSTFRKGKEVESKSFPKFDAPRPAVVIKTEANEELYKAWKHPLLDEYPHARNLAEVQSQIPIPTFLEDVFQRNNSNSIDDDYDDLNTFCDGSTYFVKVDERGNVTKVQWSGSSAYSGGTVNDYPPFIKKLTFKPGHKNGRPVACQVVVTVDHTFAEAKQGK